MPKNSFLIEDILESSSKSRQVASGLGCGSGDYRGYKKRTLTALNNHHQNRQPRINTSGSEDSDQQLRSPIIKPSPSLSLSPASSFTSSASSTNSHTPEEAHNTTSNVDYLMKQQQQHHQYLKSAMPFLFMNGFMMPSGNSNQSEQQNNHAYPPEVAFLLSTLLQQTSTGNHHHASNPDESQQFLQQQMLGSYYAKLLQNFASNLNPSSDLSAVVTSAENDSSSSPASRRTPRVNESNFFAATSAAAKNIYKLDESKLKQFGSFATAQQPNYFLNSVASNDSSAETAAHKLNLSGKVSSESSNNRDKIAGSGMSPPASGDDCSFSSIENVSPLDALLKLANNTFVSRAGLISNVVSSNGDEIKFSPQNAECLESERKLMISIE
jgi:hypothetical protein